MRSGPELVRASSPFAQEDRGLTWRLLGTSLVVWGAFLAAAALAPWWPVRLVASLLAGCTLVRLFIFYHDFRTGRSCRSRRWARRSCTPSATG
jgi:omega-6 fatty acid desaturase (delta-12 desaturase)